MGAQETGGTPNFQLLGTDAEPLRHLRLGQHSLHTQSLETTLQSYSILNRPIMRPVNGLS